MYIGQFFVLAADPPADWAVFQRDLLVSFFEPDFRHEFHNPITEDLCAADPANRQRSWWYVHCENDLVVSIVIVSQKAPTFEVDQAPPHLQELVLKSCDQNFPLLTRLLPRNLRLLSIGSNRIYGSPDLTCLPRQLENFHAPHNFLTGVIYLSNLPDRLEVLSLVDNRISQGVVYFEMLSPKIKQIALEGNQILHIEKAEGKASKEERQVFFRMKGTVR